MALGKLIIEAVRVSDSKKLLRYFGRISSAAAFTSPVARWKACFVR